MHTIIFVVTYQETTVCFCRNFGFFSSLMMVKEIAISVIDIEGHQKLK